MSDKKKKFWFWTKTVAQGVGATALAFLPEIMQQFPEHTAIFKLALPAAFLWKYLKVKKSYQKDDLPSGLTRLLDKVPDSVTGVRGSENVRGTQEEKL